MTAAPCRLRSIDSALMSGGVTAIEAVGTRSDRRRSFPAMPWRRLYGDGRSSRDSLDCECSLMRGLALALPPLSRRSLRLHRFEHGIDNPVIAARVRDVDRLYVLLGRPRMGRRRAALRFLRPLVTEQGADIKRLLIVRHPLPVASVKRRAAAREGEHEQGAGHGA